MSKLGLILCTLYVTISALCIWAGVASSDPKGSFVLLQLPLALQATLLHSLGVDRFLGNLSWPTTYAVLGLPTLAILYSVGAAIGSITQHLVRGVQQHAP